MPPKEKTTQKTSKSPSKSTPKTKKKPTPKDGNKIFNVEKILDKKKDSEHGYLYKIKWEGFTEAEATWEPVENLKAVPGMVAAFEESLVDNDSDYEIDHEKEETEKKTKSKKTKTPKEKEPKEKKARKNPAAEKGIKPKKKLKTEKDTAPAQTPSNLKPKYGHYQFNDTPEAISKGRKEEDCLIFLVTWRARKDGTVPKPTEMTSLELRRYDKDLLLNFYESKLTFKHVKPQPEEGRSRSVEKARESKKKEIEEEEEEEKVSEENERIETENNEEFDNLQPADEVIEQEPSENKDHEEKEAIDVENFEGENPAEENKGNAQTNEQEFPPTLLIGDSEGSEKNNEEEIIGEIESPKEIVSDFQSNHENNQENQNANQDNIDELDFLAS